MKDKQTNSWEEEFDKRFNEDTLVSAHTDWTPKAIKQFISKTISQEKEKWVKQLEELKNKEQDWNNNWERNGYEIGINAVINLMQNK